MLEIPHIAQADEFRAAVIRLNIPRNQIHQVMDPAIQEVFAAIAAQGISPARPVFSHHLRMDPEVFDFEVGVPIVGDFNPAGRVTPGVLPAARVARAVYQGEYDRLADAWAALMDWIEAEGHTPAEDLWECYLVTPESSSNPADWRTEINRPLAEVGPSGTSTDS